MNRLGRMNKCAKIQFVRPEDTALQGCNRSAGPDSKTARLRAARPSRSFPHLAGFDSKAKNPRGCGGQSPLRHSVHRKQNRSKRNNSKPGLCSLRRSAHFPIHAEPRQIEATHAASEYLSCRWREPSPSLSETAFGMYYPYQNALFFFTATTKIGGSTHNISLPPPLAGGMYPQHSALFAVYPSATAICYLRPAKPGAQVRSAMPILLRSSRPLRLITLPKRSPHPRGHFQCARLKIPEPTTIHSTSFGLASSGSRRMTAMAAP